jgi:hypothetical protein
VIKVPKTPETAPKPLSSPDSLSSESARVSVNSTTWHLRHGRGNGLNIKPHSLMSYETSYSHENMKGYMSRITGNHALALCLLS